MISGRAQDQLAGAYRGRRVLVTGHTGFKGSWLTFWLGRLGAQVTGFALAPRTTPALFDVLGLQDTCEKHVLGDLRDARAVRRTVNAAAPEIIFHLAAQPLVRESYLAPLETFETNVMGTAHLLEAVRLEKLPAAIVVVTTDKCYANREWAYAYREDDALGGHDPYAASKAAAEIVAASYRDSFFGPNKLGEHGVAIATARAGNVVGGGDWARDRIVPDAIAALSSGAPIPVRNPASIRPWQHVLEPLYGYLLLGARLQAGTAAERARFCEAWNFGPRPDAARPVRQVVESLIAAWGSGSWEDRSDPNAPHEGKTLRLAIDKAVGALGWRPTWDFHTTFRKTVAFYRAQHEGQTQQALGALIGGQVDEFLAAQDVP